MAPRHALACIVLALVATGCITSSVASHPHMPEPEVVAAEGTYRHASSGMEFPERLGYLRRQEVVRYDEAGIDVSASYRPPPGSFPILATVYVYPGREDSSFLVSEARLEESRRFRARFDYAHERDGVLRGYEPEENAALVSDEEVALPLGGAERRGFRAEFRCEGAMGIPGVKCTSLLYWFPSVDGKWNVKYRLTFLRSDVPPHKAIAAVLEGAPWPVAPR